MLLLLIILVLLAGAFISLILPAKYSNLEYMIELLSALVGLLGLVLIWNDFIFPTWWVEFESFELLAIEGMSFSLAPDSLSMVFAGFSLLLTNVALIFIPKNTNNFNSAFLLTGGLATGIFLSQNPLTFYIFWTLLLLSAFLFLVDFSSPENNYFSLKFVLMALAGNLAFLFFLLNLAGVDIAWGRGLPAVETILQIKYYFEFSGLIFWTLLLGFALTIPLVPFHTWFINMIKKEESYQIVLLAILLPAAAVYGLVRFWLPLFPTRILYWRQLLTIIIGLGIVYTGFLAWTQTNLRKLVAYGLLNQFLISLVGIVTGEQLIVIAGIFHFLVQGLLGAGILLLTSFCARDKNEGKSRSVITLARKAPVTATVFVLFVLTAFGVPPFAGFVSKLFLFSGIYSFQPKLLFLIGIGILISILYFTNLIKKIVFTPVPSDKYLDVNFSFLQVIALLFLFVPIIFWGFYPTGFVEDLESAVYSLETPPGEVQTDAN